MTDKKGLIERMGGSEKIIPYVMVILIGLFQWLLLFIYTKLPKIDLQALPGEMVTIYFVGFWGLLNTFMIFFYGVVKWHNGLKTEEKNG